MEFWNEFSSTVKDAANQTVKGAEKLSNIAKLKYKITGVTDKLNLCYRTLGEMYYSEKRGREVSEDSYRMLLEKTDVLKATLAELEGKLTKLRSYRSCKMCGSKVSKGSGICPKCGEKQPDEDDD